MIPHYALRHDYVGQKGISVEHPASEVTVIKEGWHMSGANFNMG
jgi:hypothetical protein